MRNEQAYCIFLIIILNVSLLLLCERRSEIALVDKNILHCPSPFALVRYSDALSGCTERYALEVSAIGEIKSVSDGKLVFVSIVPLIEIGLCLVISSSNILLILLEYLSALRILSISYK